MAIRVKCQCGKVLSADDKYAGKRAKCPACGAAVQLPGAAGQELRPSDAPAAAAAPRVGPPPAAAAAPPRPAAAAPPRVAPPPAAVAAPRVGPPPGAVRPPMARPAMQGGMVAPPPSRQMRVPTEVPAKLQRPDLPPCWLELVGDGAVLDTQCDSLAVTSAFVETFAKRLKKRHNVVLEAPPAGGAPAARVQVISMEEGNHFLRFLIGLFAGQAHFEVGGTVIGPAGEQKPFRFRVRSFGSWFTTNEGCLKMAASNAAVRVAKLLK